MQDFFKPEDDNNLLNLSLNLSGSGNKSSRKSMEPTSEISCLFYGKKKEILTYMENNVQKS